MAYKKETAVIDGVEHSKVTTSVEGDSKECVSYYVYRTNKAGKVVRAVLNNRVHRFMISRIETSIACQ